MATMTDARPRSPSIYSKRGALEAEAMPDSATRVGSAVAGIAESWFVALIDRSYAACIIVDASRPCGATRGWARQHSPRNCARQGREPRGTDRDIVLAVVVRRRRLPPQDVLRSRRASRVGPRRIRYRRPLRRW